MSTATYRNNKAKEVLQVSFWRRKSVGKHLEKLRFQHGKPAQNEEFTVFLNGVEIGTSRDFPADYLVPRDGGVLFEAD